jgi:3-hexulose-6-phosphate synthase/6-phospho-3-hexuloisomerase
MDDKPILQVALDFVDLPRALRVAREAAAGGADWLEAGTPLVKSAGLEAVRRLKEEFPNLPLVADLKTFDTGRFEVEIAAKAGADVVTVMAAAPDSTIRESVAAARNYGVRIMADLLGVADPDARARQLEEMGVDFVNLHVSIDQQMEGSVSFDAVRRLAAATGLPIAASGGINQENAAAAADAGAGIIIVGGAVTKSEDATAAVRLIREALAERKSIPSTLFRRVGLEGVAEILAQVSTANISDAMHRAPSLGGLRPVGAWPGLKMAGPALTVRTCPGDWAKPVEAVDAAAPGTVIVIDAGGVPPAVWGELATNSAAGRKLAGVVIEGAIRDSGDIADMRFPAWSRHVCPEAGEPKGYGEIGPPVRIAGRQVCGGDWVIGDVDGLMVVPRDRVVEIANRAMDVLERENRLRREIRDGGTLGRIAELLKWEKK